MPCHISQREMKSARIKCMEIDIKDKRSKRVQLKRFNLSRTFKVIKKLFQAIFSSVWLFQFFFLHLSSILLSNESQKWVINIIFYHGCHWKCNGQWLTKLPLLLFLSFRVLRTLETKQLEKCSQRFSTLNHFVLRQRARTVSISKLISASALVSNFIGLDHVLW